MDIEQVDQFIADRIVLDAVTRAVTDYESATMKSPDFLYLGRFEIKAIERATTDMRIYESSSSGPNQLLGAEIVPVDAERHIGVGYGLHLKAS